MVIAIVQVSVALFMLAVQFVEFYGGLTIGQHLATEEQEKGIGRTTLLSIQRHPEEAVMIMKEWRRAGMKVYF